jgi:phosphatidylinositol-3-phosphatase
MKQQTACAEVCESSIVPRIATLAKTILEGKVTHQMIKKAAALALSFALTAAPMFANEGPVPKGVPHLDHVFVIMMENHAYNQILNNPNAPFIDKFAKRNNLATNYFAIAHPSLTNYLETVGGSNFGVHADNFPNWHSETPCSPNLTTGFESTDTPATPTICPIEGTGTDAATVAIDCTNEFTCPPGSTAGDLNIDGIKSIPAAHNISGKTIADQLVEHGLSWKSYQQSLPLAGPDLVATSDGEYTDTTDFSQILPAQNPPLAQADVVALYAVKHNPFVYFQNVQEGHNPRNSFKNVVSFEGKHGLYADLASGDVPEYSFIAPNQCNDQHGRSNGGAFCAFDPNDDGMQDGLNPALIYRGDVEVQRIVEAIHNSPAWERGNSAIVLLWDENDYSPAPTLNKVVFVVDTNYGPHGVQSSTYYNHFSLLKTVEAAFDLPCLNHACDPDVKVISDLFEGGHGRH